MSNKDYVENEINLHGCIKVILKRKKVILIVFFVAVIAAAITSFRMPKVYETSTKIRMGSISGPVMSIQEIEQIIQSRAIVDSVAQKLNIGTFGLGDIKVEEIAGTNLLKIKIERSRPDLAAKILNAAADSCVLRIKEVYDKKIAFLNEQAEEMEKRGEFIKRQMEMLGQKVTARKVEPDFPLLKNTISTYAEIYAKLREKVYTLREQLMNSEEPEIFETALKPTYPIKPKNKRNIAISAVLGLMLGVFIAFFQEF